MHSFAQNWGGKALCSCHTITLKKHIEYQQQWMLMVLGRVWKPGQWLAGSWGRLSNFHFWLWKHIQNTPFNFFLNLNRNQVHQNQKKPSEGRKEGHQRKKATAERSRPERNSRWGNRAAQEARHLGRCLEGERKNISAAAQCCSCLGSTEENNTGDQLGQVTSQLWGERKKISFYHFFEHRGGEFHGAGSHTKWNNKFLQRSLL